MKELEENLFSVVDFLKKLTKDTVGALYPDLDLNLPSNSLLSGEYLCKAWDGLYCEKIKMRKEYGIYFIFLNNIENKYFLIPLYVGKGLLPIRCFEHFGLTQYIDMLLAGYFGGVPRNPKNLDGGSEHHKKILDALRDFEIGFLLIDEAEAKDLEKKFIRCLAPLANTEIYNKFIQVPPPFSLSNLVRYWPNGLKGESFQEIFQKTLPDLGDLKTKHANILDKLKTTRLEIRNNMI